jgi:Zn-dependent metalloprotease
MRKHKAATTITSVTVLALIAGGTAAVLSNSSSAASADSTPAGLFSRPANVDGVMPAITNVDAATRNRAVSQALRAMSSTNAFRTLGSDQNAYTARTVAVDPDGVKHVRFDRTYEGMPVYGGQVVVEVAPNGSKMDVSAHLAGAVSLHTKATVSKNAAMRQARRALRGQVTAVSTPKLVVDATTGRPTLAYETIVYGQHTDQTPSKLHVISDARTGRVLSTNDEIEAVTGQGDGIYDGQVQLDVTQSGNGFTLQDPAHGNGTTTDLQNATNGGGQLVTSQSQTFGNGQASDRNSAAADAHFGAAATFDFYKQVMGRNGIFGDGRGVPSRVHYGNNFENAFWDGQEMSYGDGQGNAKPLTELDVAGHEMSHGVSGALTGWGENGETGGLNEGTSDIFGMMVEFHANLASDPANYTIGKKLNFNGDGKPLRYMFDPHLDGQTPDCYTSTIGQLDPHFSLGPLSHWYFLLAEGSGKTQFGTSPTCDNSTLTGIGRDKAAKIWFQALAAHANANENYADARTDSLKAAADLFGAHCAEYQAVDAAWKAVAVTGQDPVPGTCKGGGTGGTTAGTMGGTTGGTTAGTTGGTTGGDNGGTTAGTTGGTTGGTNGGMNGGTTTGGGDNGGTTGGGSTGGGMTGGTNGGSTGGGTTGGTGGTGGDNQGGTTGGSGGSGSTGSGSTGGQGSTGSAGGAIGGGSTGVNYGGHW